MSTTSLSLLERAAAQDDSEAWARLADLYGCLGLAIIRLGRPGSHIAIGLIAAILLARLGSSAIHLPEQGRMLSADLAHLIAFPLGACLGLRCRT